MIPTSRILLLAPFIELTEYISYQSVGAIKSNLQKEEFIWHIFLEE